MTQNPNEGVLIIIAAASGTGKSTVCHLLLDELEKAQLSISYTTRAPRRGEKNGEHYHFISKEEFEKMIERGDFLEWAKVHDHYYGTGKSRTKELLQQGYDILLDIDIQGAKNIKKIFPDEAITIFLLPPSWQVMVNRLTNRGTETQERIQRRLQTALEELPQAAQFEYIVVNDQLKQTVQTIKAILQCNRTRPHRMRKTLDELLRQLPKTEAKHSEK